MICGRLNIAWVWKNLGMPGLFRVLPEPSRAWWGALFVSFKIWLPYMFWVIFLYKKHSRSILRSVLKERLRKVKGRVKAVPWCWEVLWRLANAATFSTKYVLTEEVFFNRSRIFLLKENRLLAGWPGKEITSIKSFEDFADYDCWPFLSRLSVFI